MIPMHDFRSRSFKSLAKLTLFALATCPAMAQTTSAPALSFSGYVDADFATSFAGGGLKDPRHATGLEIDLTTTLNFSPTVNAVLYTTMNDGAVPAQGAGNTWAPVKFDGATLNWKYDDKTMVHVGDIIHGTGYFNYYFNKRTSLVVGEHALRGVGVERDGWTVATGATGLGATDSTGAPIPTSQWATFVKYEYPIDARMTVVPSLKYTGGVPGATPVNAGVSFDGTFGDIKVSADAAANYYNADYGPGFSLLIEPSYVRGLYSVTASLFANQQGMVGTNPAPNSPKQTVTGAELDNLIAYVEPGYAPGGLWAVGLPLEYHDASDNTAAAQGYDASVWAVPTLYIYPGTNIQWWVWAQIVAPLSGSGSMDPRYFAGSEMFFNF